MNKSMEGGANIARSKAKPKAERKIKVNVRIPQNAHDWIIENNYTVTGAVNEALTRWFYKRADSANFVNLRPEDIRFLDRLDEIENDFIKIAASNDQKAGGNDRISKRLCASRNIKLE